jgi:hypothetical protein
MPSISRGDLDFGTVIHAVCERYLLADDTGRDSDGEPVELYPDGWGSVTDKKGKRTISPVSADLIKRLVAKAIEEGILERRPEREVEKWFERELIPGVTMVGKIDMVLPGEIQDHKSTKAMKWAKSEKRDSPNYLGKSLQMLDYAHEALVVDPNLEVVRLRHNVFCKDPERPIVRKVDVTVTRAEVMANWQRLMKLAWEMQVLDHQELSADQWEEVPGPSEPDACEAFGGCPFLRICTKVDTPEQYRKRTDKQIKNKKPLQKAFTWDDTWGKIETTFAPRSDSMNIFDKSKARQKAKKAGKVGPAPETKPIDGSVAVIDEDIAVELTMGNAPPWAQPNCPACKGKGFNKKGSPCRICDATSKKAGGRTSLEYHVDSDGLGNVIWEAKDGSGGGSAPIADKTVEPKAQEKVELPAAPLDTPDQTDDAAPEKDIMEAVHNAGNEAADEATEEVEEKLAKKGEKALPEPKPKKPRKTRKPRKPRKKLAADIEGVEPGSAEAEAETPEAEKVEVTGQCAPPNPGDYMLGETDGDACTVEPVDLNADTRPEEILEPTPAAKPKGRPKAGYYLYIDCMPIGVETVSVEGLFAEMAAELATEMNAESYFDLDVFKRRESFARVLTAEILQERYNKMHIVARNPQGAPDLRAFVDVMISVSPKGRVIQGIR